MLSLLLLGLLAWGSCQAAAQATLALNVISGFTNLSSCEQDCLSKSYATNSEVESNCNLSQQSSVLSICQTTCPQDAEQDSAPSSVLSAFCTQAAEALSASSSTATSGIKGTTASTGTALSLDSLTTPLVTATKGTTSASGPAVNTPSAASSNGTGSLPTTISAKTELTSGAKAGLGVGVGLGIPLILAGIAAFVILSRRRKSRAARGPYGPVTTIEKGMTESADYSSPNREPQHEMHNINSGAPFLAAGAVRDSSSRAQDYHDTPKTAQSQHALFDAPTPTTRMRGKSYEELRSPQDPQSLAPGQARSVQSRDISRPSTPPSIGSRDRPATAHAHLQGPSDDEPPSPVSPISPVVSRAASFDHGDHRHDL
ncbi:hypothetical protein LTR62_001637 [Meristemomyces frigidus]|uniref:Mid2 domain-containing protein n=1 Tax=Meristemomyces frigidus TaxID=1508187 RepID=A0AAN7YBJ1_9PEZI|nr:hypothetical protein LTR62_001637 [Meristemomyces frigidus]